MATEPIYRSTSDHWTEPRPHSDPMIRYRKYGRVRPMEYPGLIGSLSDWLGMVIGRRRESLTQVLVSTSPDMRLEQQCVGLCDADQSSYLWMVKCSIQPS